MNPVAIIALIDAAITLMGRIGAIVEALKRSKELTPAEEALLDARIERLNDMPHWKGK